MAAKERGLGRGLDSLFGTARETDIASRDIHKLGINQLVTGAHQPRKWFDDTTLGELAASIKAQGIVQPLIVRPRADTTPQVYEIVAGERRWRAARMAGMTEVPVLITAYTDIEAMTVALVENLQREDLNPLEEAEGLQALRDAHGLSQEELATKLGKSRSAIANAMRLLALPVPVKEALAKGILTSGHARALLAIADGTAQETLFRRIIEAGATVREVEAAVEHWKRYGSLPAAGRNAGSRTAPTRKIRKTEKIKEIQALLREHIHHGASINGDEKNGRIALPYTSPEELDFLLGLLGVAPAGEAEPIPENLPEVQDSEISSAGAFTAPPAETAPNATDSDPAPEGGNLENAPEESAANGEKPEDIQTEVDPWENFAINAPRVVPEEPDTAPDNSDPQAEREKKDEEPVEKLSDILSRAEDDPLAREERGAA